ncbi:hypothetical protein [Streptomyces althioticus]|uniref:hypothetical protein n=1 Tax=Streptomyces althioticus TaxID=83380 RepID=UPI0033FD1B30
MTEFDDEFLYEDVKRPSKAAERRQGRQAMREELEDLMDLYPEYADVLNEVRL